MSISKYVFAGVLAAACVPAQAFDLGGLGDLGKLKEAVQQPANQPILKQLNVSPQAVNAIKELAGTSQEEEIAIGRQISGNLLGAAPLVKDAKLQQYVNSVGRWVANQSERPDLPWHFGVIDSNDVNAFAAPGGYVFVTLGLYRLLQNEADLAGVLGHEIGHVVKQHHLKILQQSKLVEAGGNLLSQQAGNNDAVQKLIGGGAEIVSRSLDKGAEFEADRLGVVFATRAGYDAYGLPSVLQQIGHVAKDDGSVALLFKTHPAPDDRLDKLSVAMGSRFDRVPGETLAQRFYRVK